jgi:hypothetical protein
MPRIYAIFAAQRHYLRNTPTGVEFTTDPTEADDIRIETPYDPAPLTLRDAAAYRQGPVVLLFPDPAASTGQSPLHPKGNTVAPGNTLAASREASQIGKRWTVVPAPIDLAEGDGYIITLSVAPDHTLAICPDTTDSPGTRPILAGRDTALVGRAPRIFYEEEPAEDEAEDEEAEDEDDGDYCESCDKPVPRGVRWCCHGCHCDVDPGYERGHRW